MTPRDTRERVIDGLRELADYLEQHPDTPVDRFGLSCVYAASDGDGDDAAVARVEAMAAALGVEVRQPGVNHWRVTRQFGEVQYGISYVSCAEMDAYRAVMSYQGTVEPVGGTS